MDFVLFLLGLLILFGLRPASSDSETTLSSGTFLPIRGIFALLIILHHISQITENHGTLLFWYLPRIGLLCVSVFFAFSGYALSAQYAEKKERYLQTFLTKRFSALLRPYLLMTFLFCGLYAASAVQQHVSILATLRDLFLPMFRSGTTVIPYSWYVEVIAVLYLLFYAAHRLFAGKRLCVYTFLLLGMLAMYFLFCALGYGDWWYKSILAFPAGMLFYDFIHLSVLQTLLQKRLLRPVLCCGLLIPCLILFWHVWQHRFSTRGSMLLLLTELSAVLFSWSILLLLQIFRIKNRLLDYAGSRSYELYLAQGLPMLLTEWKIVFIASDLLYLIFVLAGTFLIGELLYRIDKLF